jgi:hypothetical protein
MFKRFLARPVFGAALAAAMLAASPAAHAQTATPAGIAAAKELITLKGAKPMFDVVVNGVIETAKNTFLRTNPGLAKDLNETAALLRKEFESRTGQPFEEIARTFAERFTEDELKQAVAFYRTPLGQKLVDWETRALEEGMTRAQTWANRFSEEVIARMRAEMRKRGHNI